MKEKNLLMSIEILLFGNIGSFQKIK